MQLLVKIVLKINLLSFIHNKKMCEHYKNCTRNVKRTEFARVQATASHPKKRSVHDPQHLFHNEKRPEFRQSGRLWTIAGAGNASTRRYRPEVAKETIC